MQLTRSKLLITLALFCALVIGAQAWAAPAFSGPARSGTDVWGASFRPGSTPNAGEPDVGQGQAPLPPRLSQTPTGRTSLAGPATHGTYVGVAIRWARVFWMARYLRLVP